LPIFRIAFVFIGKKPKIVCVYECLSLFLLAKWFDIFITIDEQLKKPRLLFSFSSSRLCFLRAFPVLSWFSTPIRSYHHDLETYTFRGMLSIHNCAHFKEHIHVQLPLTIDCWLWLMLFWVLNEHSLKSYFSLSHLNCLQMSTAIFVTAESKY